jgi:hypothetical protein
MVRSCVWHVRRLHVRGLAATLAAGVLVSGCAATGNPASLSSLGAAHRSIKDDPAAETASPAPRGRAAAAPKTPAIRPASRNGDGSDAAACASSSACLARLKAMIASPDRSWVGRPQSAADYATGTRLFAYRALRAGLSCRELTLALGEIAAAAGTFRAGAAGIDAARASRVLALSRAVESELRTEFARRCAG